MNGRDEIAYWSDEIKDFLSEMHEVAQQPKCVCDVAVALTDESVRLFCWYRCKMCFGLVAETRLVEGTAHLVVGTVQ